jgi:hypothetical protein
MTKVDSAYLKGHRDVGGGYCSSDVYVFYRGGDTPSYGVNGAQINTGDPRSRWIHGGGSGLAKRGKFPKAPYAPYQPLTPTYGCTRGHNQDVIDLGAKITQYKKTHPGMPITYCRK